MARGVLPVPLQAGRDLSYREPGVPATLYAFIYLYIPPIGGGPWSLDALFFVEAP